MKKKNTPANITLGSLFDGIGGFPYAGSFYGIKTLWASEIIPAAISITRRHFPDMEHLGDITKLKGGEITPVDIVTFGSPCQSFSIAGQRTGLEGKSGLFWEAIRIMREMREASNGKYPRYCVFENVPGILSANRGRDYKTVLEAFTETEIPLPPSGRWTNAGMVRGGGIDVAWIIKDAQYHGVAQRRRRLFLVCDFTGQRAAEILFKPKSLHRYFTQGGAPGKRTAADASGSTNDTSVNGVKSFEENTIHATKVYGICAESSNSMKSDNPHSGIYEAETSRTIDQNCGNPSCNQGGMAIVAHDLDGVNIEKCVAAFMGGQSGAAGSIAYNEQLSPTLKSGAGGNMVPCVCELENRREVTVINDQGGDSLTIEKKELSPTLRSEAHGNLPIVSISDELKPFTAMGVNQNASGDVRIAETAYSLTEVPNSIGINGDIAGTLDAHYYKGVGERCGVEREIVLCAATGQSNAEILNNLSSTLNCNCEQPIVYIPKEPFTASETNPNPNVCGTLCAKSIAPNGIGNEADMCILQEPHKFTHLGFGHFVESDTSKTIMQTDKANNSDIIAYCLQGNMIGREEKNGPQGSGVNEEIAFTLNTADKHCVAAVFSRQRSDIFKHDDLASTQTARQSKDATDLVYQKSTAVDCRNLRETVEISGTLQSKSTGSYSLNYQNPVRRGFIVRRLTPTEAERLQGYPDGWTEYGHDGKPICDTARYQALGNSVAIPCVAYVLSGIIDEFDNE